MYASIKQVDITLPSGRVFTVCAEDWEDAPAAICCDLLTDADIEDIAQRLKAEAEANEYWVPYNEANDDADNSDCMDTLWRDYENITIEHKVFYFEDMTDEEYAEYETLCENQDEKGIKELCEQVYNRLNKKGVIPMSMESSIYLACNSVVKDGVVLGYQLGATIDGKMIQPPEGYPNGFMVRKGTSWCASLDSSWNTQAAAEERASRLNKIDNTNEWCVMVI